MNVPPKNSADLAFQALSSYYEALTELVVNLSEISTLNTTLYNAVYPMIYQISQLTQELVLNRTVKALSESPDKEKIFKALQTLNKKSESSHNDLKKAELHTSNPTKNSKKNPLMEQLFKSLNQEQKEVVHEKANHETKELKDLKNEQNFSIKDHKETDHTDHKEKEVLETSKFYQNFEKKDLLKNLILNRPKVNLPQPSQKPSVKTETLMNFKMEQKETLKEGLQVKNHQKMENTEHEKIENPKNLNSQNIKNSKQSILNHSDYSKEIPKEIIAQLNKIETHLERAKQIISQSKIVANPALEGELKPLIEQMVIFSVPYFFQNRIKQNTSKYEKFKFKKVNRKEKASNADNEEEMKYQYEDLLK